jgi:hypothetical protein
MTDQEPNLDFAALDLPSNHITLKVLTRLTPGRIAPYEVRIPFNITDRLETIRYCEYCLAQIGFGGVLGKTAEEVLEENGVGLERQDLVQDLIDCYPQFGVSQGPEAIRELARRIEAAGAAQAREKLGLIR